MNLYIPLSSRNFPSIFETESVSPKLFYTKRNFGIQRFRTINLNFDDNYIVLYGTAIFFQTSENDGYPMWLEVESEKLGAGLVDLHKYTEQVEKGKVFLYPQTIYLDSLTTRCIFSNSSHLKNTLIDSESYRSVKATNKFKIEIEDSNFFDTSITIPTVNLPENTVAALEIEKDRHFNFVKGLIYGYALGELDFGNPKIDGLNNLIIELKNSFTDAKAKMVISESSSGRFSSIKSFNTKDPRSKNYTPPSYKLSDSKKEILNILEEINSLYSEFVIPKKSIERDEVLYMAQHLLNMLEQDNTEEAILIQTKELIKSIATRNNPLELIRQATNNFFRIHSNKSYTIPEEAELAERQFKRNVLLLQKNVSSESLQQDNDLTKIKIEAFRYSNPKSINISRNLILLDTENEYILSEIILSILIKKHRPFKQGEITRDEKCDLIAMIAQSDSFINRLGSKENPTPYYADLRRLYQYYSKLSDFDLDSIKSTILKNFACFLIKIEKLEDLREFVKNKKIKNHSFAYAFWGAFNGYADFTIKSTQAIFASSDKRLLHTFDNWLINALNLISKETFLEHLEDEFDPTCNEANPKNYFTSNAISEDQENQDSQKIKNAIDKTKQLTLRVFQSLNHSKFNKEQQDDIRKAVTKSQNVIIKSLEDGAEVYFLEKHVLETLKKYIKENNKKRRKKEFKIEELDLDDFLTSIS